MTLHIALTPEQQAWANEQVAQGFAGSPEEAVLDAVEIQRLRMRIEQSKHAVSAGRLRSADEVFDELESRLAAGLNNSE